MMKRSEAAEGEMWSLRWVKKHFSKINFVSSFFVWFRFIISFHPYLWLEPLPTFRHCECDLRFHRALVSVFFLFDDFNTQCVSRRMTDSEIFMKEQQRGRKVRMMENWKATEWKTKQKRVFFSAQLFSCYRKVQHSFRTREFTYFPFPCSRCVCECVPEIFTFSFTVEKRKNCFSLWAEMLYVERELKWRPYLFHSKWENCSFFPVLEQRNQ